MRLLHTLARHQRPGDGHAAAARPAGLHFLGEVAEAQELVVNLDVGLDVAPERSPGLGLRMRGNLVDTTGREDQDERGARLRGVFNLG